MAAGYEIHALGAGPDSVALAISGRVDTGSSQDFLSELSQLSTPAKRNVALDLSQVTYFDSGGGAVLLEIKRLLHERGVELEISKSTPAIDGFLKLVADTAMEAAPAHEKTDGLVAGLGSSAIELLTDLRHLMVFTGEVILGLRDAIKQPHRIRWRETWLYMERAGLDGVPIVSLISFLMGVITGLQAATQLKQFGADIYIANLVGLSMVRELGPLMTAIISAGRSGAAFAAEIGTMKVSEEVDALTTMGFDRTRFLVTPKVLALLIMQPCLTIIADFVGILGGIFVATTIMRMPAVVYLRQTQWALSSWDVISGLIKSVVFAILIAGVGCLRGFEATSGAESVGRITTSAIVAAIFLIILADAIFTIIFRYI